MDNRLAGGYLALDSLFIVDYLGEIDTCYGCISRYQMRYILEFLLDEDVTVGLFGNQPYRHV